MNHSFPDASLGDSPSWAANPALEGEQLLREFDRAEGRRLLFPPPPHLPLAKAAFVVASYYFGVAVDVGVFEV